MFVLIWITVFVSVRSISADAGPLVWKHQCYNGYCIYLKDGLIRAKAGLCAVIPCSFTTGENFTPQHIVWYKCGHSTEKCKESDMIFNTDKTSEHIKPEFEGRVSLLEPDVSQRNCSIMINDLNKSDSGWYQLRVNGLWYTWTDGFTFSPKTQISVKDLKQKPTVMIPPLTEGQQTTLTCTAPGLCSGSPPEITWMWKPAGEEDFYIPGNITAVHTENLTAVSQRHSSSLTFNLSAEHHNTNVTCKISFTGDTTTEETVTLQVNYKRKAQISGRTTIKSGEVLNLTCSVESFPPSLIMWTKQSSNTSLQSGISLFNDTGSATLVISNMTAEDAGLYVCTATHLNTSTTEYADITVTWLSGILNGSGCVLQSAVLTCVCVSEGLPLPNIKWPLLQNHREYSVITMVSGHTVNSTVTLMVNHHDNTTVECVRSNENGEAKENLTIQQRPEKEADESRSILKKGSWLEIIVAFLIGVVFTAFSCCLTMKCFRKQQKSSGNLDETLEMVTSQDDLLIYDGQVEEDQTCIQEVPENGAVVAEKAVSEPNSGPREVVYASIDFSRLKKSPAEARKERENTKTEYAGIRTERKEEIEENNGEKAELLEDKEEEVMQEESEEAQCQVAEEEKEEKEAEEVVYSSVADLMDEI